MRAPLTTILAACLAALPACDSEPRWDGSLATFIESRPERFGPVVEDPALHRIQAIYTQIDRDADNRPSFTTFRYRVDAREYFYPASTVKLPVAVLALEKLNRLGIPRTATMLTGSAADFQRAVTSDPTAPGGLPSVAHYVRKILVVSDNEAYNRLYEFLGQQPINEALAARGLAATRIVHRLEVSLSAEQNRYTNPVQFVEGDRVLYEQDAVHGQVSYVGVRPVLLGQAEIVDGRRVEGPKDFAEKSAFPLEDQHDLLLALLFPEAVPPERRFDLGEDDYRFLYRWMSTLPAESGIDAYADAEDYPPGYVKFLLFGGSATHIPPEIRIFNKVGDAYGFLTDTAYVVDFDAGIEFILAATVYVNENRTFNDDRYEYEELGLPFLEALGRAVYELELSRERPRRPDLSRFRFETRGLDGE